MRGFAAIERGGEARSLVVPPASGAAIAPALWDWTGGAATLLTDELATYRCANAARFAGIGRKMEAHHAVHHGSGEYARTEGGLRVHTNTAEGYFGLFKRAIVGVWHRISGKHLRRYAAEHEFRWNRRQTDVADRVARCLIGQHGQLSWKDLTA